MGKWEHSTIGNQTCTLNLCGLGEVTYNLSVMGEIKGFIHGFQTIIFFFFFLLIKAHGEAQYITEVNSQLHRDFSRNDRDLTNSLPCVPQPMSPGSVSLQTPSKTTLSQLLKQTNKKKLPEHNSF